MTLNFKMLLDALLVTQPLSTQNERISTLRIFVTKESSALSDRTVHAVCIKIFIFIFVYLILEVGISHYCSGGLTLTHSAPQISQNESTSHFTRSSNFDFRNNF